MAVLIPSILFIPSKNRFSSCPLCLRGEYSNTSMKPYKAGGGWPAVFYTWRKAREAGGLLKLWRAMRSKNACKTCALGMGGQRGGMVNELGYFPEVCKKSLQAMVADMQGAIRSDFWQRYSPRELQQFSPREMEACGRLVEPVRYSRDT